MTCVERREKGVPRAPDESQSKKISTDLSCPLENINYYFLGSEGKEDFLQTLSSLQTCFQKITFDSVEQEITGGSVHHIYYYFLLSHFLFALGSH